MGMGGQFHASHFTSGETASDAKCMNKHHRHSGHDGEEKNPSFFATVYLTTCFSTDAI
jgi:hypothetical protein